MKILSELGTAVVIALIALVTIVICAPYAFGQQAGEPIEFNVVCPREGLATSALDAFAVDAETAGEAALALKQLCLIAPAMGGEAVELVRSKPDFRGVVVEVWKVQSVVNGTVGYAIIWKGLAGTAA